MWWFIVIWLLGFTFTLLVYRGQRSLLPPTRGEWAWAVVVSALWFVVLPLMVLKANMSRRD